MNEPTTEAGRRLFTDNEPMDMMESDGVTWDDVRVIEAEDRASLEAEQAAQIGALREALTLAHEALVLGNCPNPDRHPEDAERYLRALDVALELVERPAPAVEAYAARLRREGAEAALDGLEAALRSVPTRDYRSTERLAVAIRAAILAQTEGESDAR